MKTYSYNEFVKSLRDFHKTQYNQHLIPYYSNFLPEIESIIELINDKNFLTTPNYFEDLKDDKAKFSIFVDKKYVYYSYYRTIEGFSPYLYLTSSNTLEFKINLYSNPNIYFQFNDKNSFLIISPTMHQSLEGDVFPILTINDYRKFFSNHFDNTFISLIDKEVYKFISKYQKYKIFGPSYIDDLLLFQ